MTVDAHLDAAAARVAHEVAVHPVAPSDLGPLAAAFHRAESLAEAAIRAAMAEAPEGHRAELAQQLEDEQRHVAVFADWGAAARADYGPPPQVRRPPGVWYTLLLVNELAGFCQFEMLAGLLEHNGSPEGAARAAAVRRIADDERLHVARLHGWLQPLFREHADFQREVQRLAGRFVRGLDARMTQFLPRPELAPLRAGVADAIATLVNTLTAPPRPTPH